MWIKTNRLKAVQKTALNITKSTAHTTTWPKKPLRRRYFLAPIRLHPFQSQIKTKPFPKKMQNYDQNLYIQSPSDNNSLPWEMKWKVVINAVQTCAALDYSDREGETVLFECRYFAVNRSRDVIPHCFACTSLPWRF